MILKSLVISRIKVKSSKKINILPVKFKVFFYALKNRQVSREYNFYKNNQNKIVLKTFSNNFFETFETI